jgi:hypothetical protein
MPRTGRPAAPPLLCRRTFEPSRVQQQLLSEAYAQVVPTLGRRPATAAEPELPLTGAAAAQSPISPISCGGCCA